MSASGTTLGKGISIRGDITGDEDFFFDGDLEGSITLKEKRLTVGPNAHVLANIVTGDLVVFGRVEGTAKVGSRAELRQSAAFVGDLAAARLSIEDSAAIEGRVDLSCSPGVPKPPATVGRMAIEEAGFEAAPVQVS